MLTSEKRAQIAAAAEAIEAAATMVRDLLEVEPRGAGVETVRHSLLDDVLFQLTEQRKRLLRLWSE